MTFRFAIPNKAVFDYVKRPLIHPTRIERDSVPIILALKGEELLQLMNYDTTKIYKETSITLGLNTVYEFIKQLDTTYNTKLKKLFILSDMIEDSNDDPRFGKIDLTSRQGAAAFVMRMKSQTELTVINNFQKKGVKVYFVFSTENLSKPNERNAQTMLNRMELETIWRTIFQRFGYSENSDSLSFSLIDLPENFRR